MKMHSISENQQHFRPMVTEKIKNTALLKIHMAVLTGLGVCPFRKKTILSKMYAVALLGTLFCATLYAGMDRILSQKVNSEIFEKILASIVSGVLCMFYANILYSNLKTWKEWRKILQMFDSFDSTVAKNNMIVKGIKVDYLRSVLLFFAPLLYFAIESLVKFWISDVQSTDITGTLIQYIGIFFEFQITAFFWEMSNVLDSRYQCLAEHMENVLCKKVDDDKFSQYVFENGVLKVKYQYMLLYSALQDLITIFDWIVPSLICHIITWFLFYFYWMMELVTVRYEISIAMCFFIIMMSVSTNRNWDFFSHFHFD